MAEGALRWMALSPAVMMEQLCQIDEVAALPNVEVGVIEWTTPAKAFPMHGWGPLRDTAAVVGTETATALITDHRDLAQYRALFDELAAMAARGELLQAALRRLRSGYSRLAELRED